MKKGKPSHLVVYFLDSSKKVNEIVNIIEKTPDVVLEQFSSDKNGFVIKINQFFNTDKERLLFNKKIQDIKKKKKKQWLKWFYK